MPDVRVRPAEVADVDTITAIYNEGIRGRTATFETDERTAADVQKWLGDLRHPILVAEDAGVVVGWVRASTYRDRPCYAGIAEFSVYVAGDLRARGVGGRLLSAFLIRCEGVGLWKVVSRVFTDNLASRRLCLRHGFREVGTYNRHGQLDGVWRDVVIVERLLGKAAL